MSEQKRRFFEGNSATPTFIGAETVFVGNIRGAGHFVVSGEVHGDGDLQGGLNLSVTASWFGFTKSEPIADPTVDSTHKQIILGDPKNL